MASGSGTARPPIVGGLGGQTLSGTAGDDVIYADLANGATAERLSRQDAARDGGPALAGPAHAAGVVQGGAVRFYAAGAERGAGGGGGWTVTGGDRLAPVWSQTARFYDADDALTGAPALEAFAWNGAHWLVTGGAGVSLSRLDAEGVPEPLERAPAHFGAGLLHPGAFAAFEREGVLHLLVGGGWESGLTVLRFDPFGLAVAARVEDDWRRPLASISDVEIAEAGGRTFAVVASFGDGALSTWSLEGATPALRDERRLNDGETGFDLVGAAAVEVVSRGGRTWVYAASEGRLIGYRLDGDGTLTRIGAENGATALASVRLDGRDFLVAADGAALVVFEVGPGGRLDLAARLALGPGAAVSGLAAVADGERALLLAARADRDGHDLLSFRVEGDDVVAGGAGDDVIRGGPGHDTLKGGGGADRLAGEAGADRLEGGAGADRLEGGAGGDSARGGGGGDALAGGGGADTLHGRNGNDRIDGDGGADLLVGGDGADRLDGGRGRDRAEGGRGRDVLSGEAGADRLDGGGGADRIDGGSGRDRLDGNGGRDRLDGGGGRDTLDGAGGRDRLDGGGGRDALDGGGGRDRLHGGGGRDTLDGGGGGDRLKGGAGADLFRFAPGDGRDRIEDFGHGRDRLAFEDADGFDDLAIKDKGAGALVRHGDAAVLLEGLDSGELSPNDFLFK